MKIKWYGHACFLLTAADGTRILTDPCDPGTGYTLSGIEADVITVSHGHHDHNYLAAAAGKPKVYDTVGEHDYDGISIKGVHTWHDDRGGQLRGDNIVFVFNIDGLRVCHLGDLGHVPDEAACAAIGKVDVLLCPIGGVYTIDAEEALKVTAALKAHVLIPMHYRTKAVKNIKLDGPEPLLHNLRYWRGHRVGSAEVSLSPDALGENRVIILDYVQ